MNITNASVEINGGCNYSCPMCPQADGREKEFLKKLPLDSFKSICDQLNQAGCEEISLQGSGEPLLNRNIGDYISIAAEYGIATSIVTNGFNLKPTISETLINEGMVNVRVSATGYDRQTYKKWMSKDAFDHVKQNCKTFLSILAKSENSKTKLSSYHLILDNKNIEEEVTQYRKNWIDDLGIVAEIWMMHNWGGKFEGPYRREERKKRSCGRPFAPYVNVRAGGLGDKHGAVVPCCFVLGFDSQAVLGHLSESTLADIFSGEKYEQLRRAHRENRFDDIDYCKNCDQLYDAPESLVWTNVEGKQYGQHKSNQNLIFTP